MYPRRRHPMPIPKPAVPGRTRPVYAYSFDRETFRGRHASRDAALAAAEGALEAWPTIPEAIWVGRLVDVAPPTTGLGDAVTDSLTRRLADDGRDPLPNLPDAARADLDAALAGLVRDWLDDHGLVGEPRIEGISEHPLPLVAGVPPREVDEVSLLGTEG